MDKIKLNIKSEGLEAFQESNTNIIYNILTHGEISKDFEDFFKYTDKPLYCYNNYYLGTEITATIGNYVVYTLVEYEAAPIEHLNLHSNPYKDLVPRYMKGVILTESYALLNNRISFCWGLAFFLGAEKTYLYEAFNDDEDYSCFKFNSEEKTRLLSELTNLKVIDLKKDKRDSIGLVEKIFFYFWFNLEDDFTSFDEDLKHRTLELGYEINELNNIKV